jgi:hypothetical protein
MNLSFSEAENNEVEVRRTNRDFRLESSFRRWIERLATTGNQDAATCQQIGLNQPSQNTAVLTMEVHLNPTNESIGNHHWAAL